MKKLSLYLFLVLIFSLYTSHSFAVSFKKSSCGFPKNSVKKLSIEGKKYIQFTLKDKQKGCSATDRKPRHGSPYWERVEYAQVNTLSKKKNNEINFKVKILKGFLGQRETFFQIHNYNENFMSVYPSLMFKFHTEKTNDWSMCSPMEVYIPEYCYGNDGKLIPKTERKQNKSFSFFQIDYLTDFTCLKKKGKYCAKSKGGHEKKKFQTITVNDFLNKWMNFKIVISKIINEKGFVTIFINDNIVFDKVVVHFPKRGTPRIKYGIYRPGNLKGNNTSQILYSKINVNSKK